MSNAELIYEEVKTLPEDCTAQILDFVQYVKQKEISRTEIEREVEEAGDSWFEKGEPCPICAKHRDPVTGEELFNDETIAAIEEGDAILRGEIPSKRYNSLDEFFADLDSDD